MLYSLSSFSESGETSSDSTDESLDDSVDDELRAIKGVHLTSEHTDQQARPEASKSFSTNSSPIKHREYDADHDLKMNTVRAYIGNPLTAMLSCGSRTKHHNFDLHHDPFSGGSDLKAPATADSTRSRKKVTWGGLDSTRTTNMKPSSNAVSVKSSLKKSHFAKISHFNNISQPDLSHRPPSSQYSLTPDGTTENIPHMRTTPVAESHMNHPYDTTDQYDIYDRPTSSTLVSNTAMTGPETLTSLFSPPLDDIDSLPTSAISPAKAGSRLRLEEASRDMALHSLSRKFDGLNISGSKLVGNDEDCSMRDANVLFSLRLRGKNAADNDIGVSVQESDDGSFEDILGRNPPQLPNISGTQLDATLQLGLTTYGSDLRPTGLTSSVGFENTQTMTMLKDRIAKLTLALGAMFDYPTDDFSNKTENFGLGEQVGCLEMMVAQLSTKLEDKRVMKMVYDGKLTQLNTLAESLSDENSSIKSECRSWRLKFETEHDDFETTLKRLFRIVGCNTEAFTGLERQVEIDRFVQRVKGLLLQGDRVGEIVSELRNREAEVTQLRSELSFLNDMKLSLENKSRECTVTNEQLERYKRLLNSLESEHRELKNQYDQMTLSNQSQTEELHIAGVKWSQAVQQLRDQTAILSEAQAELECQSQKYQGLEDKVTKKEAALLDLETKIATLEEDHVENERLKSELLRLTVKIKDLDALQNEVNDLRAQIVRDKDLLHEIETLRDKSETAELQIESLLISLEEHQKLVLKTTNEADTTSRQQKRLLFNKDEEIKQLQLLLLDANDMANEYSQQLSFHRDRLSDTIQKYNHLGRSLDDINDQNRDLRSSLLKNGAQRDELKRAFHALEVSCVRCLDGVIQEDSLEGIKQGLNAFGLMDEFTSRDLVILEDSASFLNEALALLAKEYRMLLRRVEGEQRIPLRKQKRTSKQKAVAIDDDVTRLGKDTDSMLSASKYVTPSRPMTRATSRMMRRHIDAELTVREPRQFI